MNDRHIDLIVGFVDCALSEAEHAELLDAACEDTVVAEALLREVEMHRSLQFVSQERNEKNEQDVQEILHYLRASGESRDFMNELEQRRTKERVGRRIAWGVPLAMAASLAVIVGVWRAGEARRSNGRQGRSRVARVEEVRGQMSENR